MNQTVPVLLTRYSGFIQLPLTHPTRCGKLVLENDLSARTETSVAEGIR